MELLLGFLAGLGAALAAYGFNRTVVVPMGTDGVAYLVPLVEESLKTGTALLLGVPLVAVHSAFGLAEGIYDLKTSIRGWFPALAGLISHVVFGLVTWGLWRATGFPWAGWLGAVAMHTSWNFLVAKVLPRH